MSLWTTSLLTKLESTTNPKMAARHQMCYVKRADLIICHNAKKKTKAKLCFIILHFLTCNFSLVLVVLLFVSRQKNTEASTTCSADNLQRGCGVTCVFPDMTQPRSIDIMCVCSACAVRGSWDNSFMPLARKHMCSVSGKCRAVTCLLNVLCTLCQHFFPKEAVDQRCLWSGWRAHL